MDGWTDQKIIETERNIMPQTQSNQKKSLPNVPQSKSRSNNNVATNQNYAKPKKRAAKAVQAFAAIHPELTPKTAVYLENTLVNSKAIHGPAIAAVNSAISRASMQTNIPINSTGWGGVLFTANPKTPLSVLTYYGTSTLFTQADDYKLFPFSEGLGLNTKFTLGAESFENAPDAPFKPTYVRNPGGPHLLVAQGTLPNRDRPQSVDAIYSGTINNIVATVTSNVVNTATIGGKFKGTGLEEWQDLLPATFPMLAATPTVCNYPCALGDGSYSFWISFASTITNAVGTHVMSQFNINVDKMYYWKPIGFIGSAYNTQVLNLWLETASMYRTVACDLLLTNANPELYRNGTISGAEIQAANMDQLIPEPQTIFNWIATAPTPQHAVNMQLKDGCHVSYMPNTQNDLEFKETSIFDDDALVNKAFTNGWVIIWKSLDDPELLQPLIAELNMSFELMTGQQIIPREPCPHIMELWSAWMLFNAAYLRIGKNNTHVQRAKTAVSKFLQKPSVKRTLSYIGEGAAIGAKVAIPAFLAML